MRLGAQLYTFEKTALLKNPDFIFRSLGELGYAAVEMPFMMDIADYMNQYNLQYSALHLLTEELHSIGLAAIVKHLHDNKCQNLCVSGPFIWLNRNADDFVKTAIFLNNQAQLFQAEGITLHYHNHDFEFIALKNGQKPMDILLSHLDVELLKLCVDTGWLSLVGADPIVFLQKNKAHISYLHLRDFLQGNSVALGEGSINIKLIMNELQNNYPLQALLVEHNPSVDALQQFAVSRAYLREQFSL